MARKQLLGLPAERGDQQRGAAGVRGGVGVRHLLGQQAAGDLGRDRLRRDEDDGADPRVDRGRDGVDTSSSSRPAITKPPSSAGATLSG